jgi:hypothetical protein
MLMRAVSQHLLGRLVGKLTEVALNSGVGKKVGDFVINPTLWVDRLRNQKLTRIPLLGGLKPVDRCSET